MNKKLTYVLVISYAISRVNKYTIIPNETKLDCIATSN
jgi:hypothetical protein